MISPKAHRILNYQPAPPARPGGSCPDRRRPAPDHRSGLADPAAACRRHLSAPAHPAPTVADRHQITGNAWRILPPPAAVTCRLRRILPRPSPTGTRSPAMPGGSCRRHLSAPAHPARPSPTGTRSPARPGGFSSQPIIYNKIRQLIGPATTKYPTGHAPAINFKRRIKTTAYVFKLILNRGRVTNDGDTFIAVIN